MEKVIISDGLEKNELKQNKVKKNEVNNDYYHHLGDDWYGASDDPIALLRAESKIKNPWVLNTIRNEQGEGKKKVLDVGCGAGFLSNYLAEQSHEVSGVDMSEESLLVARKHDVTGSVNYTYGDAYNLPFPDSSFDAVCAMDFLEHVEEPERVIQEASRVLKPGGTFFFHTFSKNFLAYIMVIKMLEWFLPKTPKNLHILRLFISPKQLIKMNTLAGLNTKHTMGIKPIFLRRAFWKSLFSRSVHPHFEFEFTKSTLLSYVGYAEKTNLSHTAE